MGIMGLVHDEISDLLDSVYHQKNAGDNEQFSIIQRPILLQKNAVDSILVCDTYIIKKTITTSIKDKTNLNTSRVLTRDMV